MADPMGAAMIHPARLGKYEIDSVLGSGGMGVVYRAFDRTAQRAVALKAIRKDLPWQDCVALTVRLDHPGIVGIYEYGEEGELALIAMELVDGCTLFDCLHENMPLPISDVVSITAQLLDALGYAHDRGIIHRDVKPANIMLTRDGRLKLADFGLACAQAANLPRVGAPTGTPSYMAPEQIGGRDSDSRADLFSVGVLLCEMLTGVNPFSGTSTNARQICSERMGRLDQTWPDVPEQFQPLIAKALANDPDDRFPSAAQFSKALEGLCDQTASAWPVSGVSTATLWRASLRKQAASEPTWDGAAAPACNTDCSPPPAPQPTDSRTGDDPDERTLFNVAYACDDRTLYNAEYDTGRERRDTAEIAQPVAEDNGAVITEVPGDVPGDRHSSTPVRYSFALKHATRGFRRAHDETDATYATPPPEPSVELAPSPPGSTELIARPAQNAMVPWSSPFPAQELEAAERHLARFIGPIAKYCVRRAAIQAANLDQLYAHLAEQLDTDQARRDFLSQQPRPASHAGELPGAAHRPAGAQRDEFPPDLLDAAASQLAEFVGPIARLLAKRAARQARNARELYSILADELAEPERAAFLRRSPP